MRLLLVNQFFWPDWAATAQLLGDLAEAAAAEGFEVTAVAGRGTYMAPSGTRLAKEENRNGVNIRRVACTNLGRGSLVGRVLDYLTFYLSAAIWLSTRKRFDVAVCLSTPPLIASLGVLLKLRGTKFIYKVEDLYPDLAVALGALAPGSVLARSLGAVSSKVLTSAEVCVALDEAMGRVLKYRGAREVVVIPNWADGQAIRPDPEAGRAFRAEHDIPAGLMILYSGNLGNAHRFDAVCSAIQTLHAEKALVQFLFVGAGPRLEEVKSRLQGLDSVRFMPYQPRERLGAIYNAADIHLVTLDDKVAGKLVPSKYSASLAAGRPVLLIGGREADLFDEINREGVGWALPHDARQIAQVLGFAADNPLSLSEVGNHARGLFDRKYSKTRAIASWLDLLRDVQGRFE